MASDVHTHYARILLHDRLEESYKKMPATGQRWGDRQNSCYPYLTSGYLSRLHAKATAGGGTSPHTV